MRRGNKSSALVKAIKEMQEGATIREMVEASGLYESTLQRWVREFRKQKASYIEGWERDVCGRNMVPVHRLGEGVDAKRPKRMSSAERSVVSRERKQLRLLQAALTGAVTKEKNE